MSRGNEDAPNKHQLSVDLVLEILSQYQRREILRFCRDAPTNTFPMHQVITHLRDIEAELNDEEPGTDHLQSVLMHVHGPKLDTVGLVEYDIGEQYIEYFPNDQIETALEHIDRMEDDW
ncbi:hypothetical protein Halru_2408 [Halovivax ruber XH-70]|uniref:DUF7344 domain-containing protein n=2 Tax=Halovivax ruber TaxID=387341 RepID=L0IG84_HALRX|nr:hypothetical protein Halru_2408 [Halovivax ruber XH-70]